MAQWTMINYRRQIGSSMEAGANMNINDSLFDPAKIRRKPVADGVVSDDKKKWYWVDGTENEEKVCCEIYARGLNITNSDRPIYWQWRTDSDGIEVAEVIRTRWLEVRGSFWTMDLTPNVLHKVSLQVKMARDSSSMAGEMVDLRMICPDGSYQEKQEPLPGGTSWQELVVGKFSTTPQNVGKMEFAVEQLFRRWKNGLVIRSVKIEPQESECQVDEELPSSNHC